LTHQLPSHGADSVIPKQDADRITFGYLSTWDSPQQGCLGGYLLVCEFGRPLEFHCTAPLHLSRAQHILYGSTLWPYVFGERIARTLLQAAKLRPDLLITNHSAVLEFRRQFGIPMARLSRDSAANREARPPNLKATGSVVETTLGSDITMELPHDFQKDREVVLQLLTRLAGSVDLVEPFERIAEAIREAQRIDESEAHEHAA
jgi:hypothetical protein